MEPWDVVHLTTGASGLPTHSVDTRFGSNTYNLPNGPYQISRVGPDYDQYINSPVHRFYQNWQQADCSIDHATLDNPSGCQMDLFAWVETSVGAGSNGKPQPVNFNDETTGEGATALGSGYPGAQETQVIVALTALVTALAMNHVRGGSYLV